MIKKIFHSADWHLKENVEKHKYFILAFEKMFSVIKDFDLGYDEGLIVVTGDLFDQKGSHNNSTWLMMYNCIQKLLSLHKVLIITGNHDISPSTQHPSALLLLTTFINNKKNLYYSEKTELIKIDNLTFTHFCFLDNFNLDFTPEGIGLYHAVLDGAILPNKKILDNQKNNITLFRDCAVVLMGDIHKHQIIKNEKTTCYYVGSLFQQDFGETINKHGIGVYDIIEQTYQFIDFSEDVNYSQKTFLKIKIDNINDIIDNQEKILNYE